MINPRWLELPMFRTHFHGPKDVRAIEVQLYSEWNISALDKIAFFNHKLLFLFLHENKCAVKPVLTQYQRTVNSILLE